MKKRLKIICIGDSGVGKTRFLSIIPVGVAMCEPWLWAPNMRPGATTQRAVWPCTGLNGIVLDHFMRLALRMHCGGVVLKFATVHLLGAALGQSSLSLGGMFAGAETSPALTCAFCFLFTGWTAGAMKGTL